MKSTLNETRFPALLKSALIVSDIFEKLSIHNQAFHSLNVSVNREFQGIFWKTGIFDNKKKKNISTGSKNRHQVHNYTEKKLY